MKNLIVVLCLLLIQPGIAADKAKDSKPAFKTGRFAAPFLSLCYSRAVGGAFQRQSAQALVQAAGAAAPSVQPALLKAGVRFLIGHAYADDLNAPQRALPSFKAAGALLDKASFTLPAFSDRDTEGRQWIQIRKAWLDFVEKGLQQKNSKQTAAAEGELDKLPPGSGVSKREWLFPQENSQRSGSVVFQVEALHPNECDPSMHYRLPFLADMQVFRITVMNGGTTMVFFNSDDVIIENDGSEIVCLSPEEVSRRLTPPLAFQQFIHFEKSPLTFSDHSFRLYNEAMVYCNRMRDALMSKDAALPQPSSQDPKLHRFYQSLDNVVFKVRADMEEAGVIGTSISHYRSEADVARKAEQYGTAHYFSAMANKAQAEMDLENGFSLIRNRLEGVMAQVASRQSFELREAAGRALLPTWDNSAYSNAVRLELAACNDAAGVKIREFFEADILPPLKGSGKKKVDTTITMGQYMSNLQNPDAKSAGEEEGLAVRVKPRSQWKGFLVFDLRSRMPAESNLVLNPKIGNERANLMFAMKQKTVTVLKPPLLSHQTRYVESGNKWGKLTLTNPVDWYAFLPVLSFQK